MAARTVETVEGMRGILWKMGLGTPIARAFSAGVVATGILYLSGLPKEAFREDGTMKAFKPVSKEADATNTHFLLAPVAIAVATGLFT